MAKANKLESPTQVMNIKDERGECSLRPPSFEEFIGQAKTVERLKVMTSAALKWGEALSHILLSGLPGLGKTTLAIILG